ncbi:DUF1240 domain-containing protein [Xenorhabdus hominickii]|uniref:Membrane protein n=1 Tax=Xenorhabdus hominickii TaxID=351679 RepID=A0A1V0M4T5_XENHO|nr:DUF1240 domain-containing protein [Xenorhabdus hominickii]ARD69891.1 hypothetical protein [Xenorhabdus hominickii]PHM51443.1 membrane protein [Xenorhabdus hominickii]
MNNKNKLAVAIWMLFLFLIANVALFFSIGDVLLVYHLSDVVFFSWRVFSTLFFYPLICYFCISTLYYLSFSRMPKRNNSIYKILTFIGILGFFISFPVSWYTDLKLKENGYIICYKKSLTSQNKYVINEKLCD